MLRELNDAHSPDKIVKMSNKQNKVLQPAKPKLGNGGLNFSANIDVPGWNCALATQTDTVGFRPPGSGSGRAKNENQSKP